MDEFSVRDASSGFVRWGSCELFLTGRRLSAVSRSGVGRGVADPGDRVVHLSALMGALFDGPTPVVDRVALGDAREGRSARIGGAGGRSQLASPGTRLLRGRGTTRASIGTLALHRGRHEWSEGREIPRRRGNPDGAACRSDLPAGARDGIWTLAPVPDRSVVLQSC